MRFGSHAAPDEPVRDDHALAADYRRRIRNVLWTFLGLLVVVALKLLVVHRWPDARLIDEEKKHEARILYRDPRGEIRDRDGKLLAQDRQISSIKADPRLVEQPKAVASVLSQKMGIDEQKLLEQFSRRDKDGNPMKFIWVKRWLTDEEVNIFKELDPEITKGLTFETESVRYYPEGELAAHLLGFVNREGFGGGGVELVYDRYLRSVPEKRRTRVDAKRRMLESFTLEYSEPSGAEDVYLTIDKTIQRKLEQEIDKALVNSQAPSGMGIVVDPRTGAILALACRPAFDPNEPWNVPAQDYKNRALVDVFEPGSSFKIVVAAAALEHGLITRNTMVDCENGFFNPYGHLIKDFHKMGVEPFEKCFAESSNIAMIKVAAMLGPDRMEAWVSRFGLGRVTCTDFPGESRGIVHPRRTWSKLTMGAIPIGQEVSVTMPQLARAFCAIANGGVLLDLHLVDRVVDRDGHTTYRHEPKPAERILSEETAATMRELCHLVVLHGTGKPASIPEYRVCGKTGTAQIAKPGGGGYLPDKYTTIFAGFAPLAEPRLCAVITISEPAIRLHYGGSVCGPVFKEVVRDALTRMNCPLDPVQEQVEKGEPDTDDADTMMARNDNDALASVLPEPEDPLDSLALSSIDSTPMAGEPVLADLTGMTKRQAKSYVDVYGLEWQSQGAGRVVSQDPPPGTPLRDVTTCHLVFSNEERPKGKNEAKRVTELSPL